jgi:hypothetical protein
MEASQGQPPAQNVAPEGVASQEGVGEQPTAPPGQAAAPPAQPVPGTAAVPEGAATGQATPPAAEGEQQADEEVDRNPARDQAPVATEAGERQAAIQGDPGFREQTPQVAEGNPGSVDTPFGSSMPAPESQSGMPLPEDRAAAAQEGESGQQQAAQPEEARAS